VATARTKATQAGAAILPRDYHSPDERRAAGKALRDKVPRSDHGGWKAQKDRRDPVELLKASSGGRLPHLVPIRFGRMAQSPFAFYRGAAALMAADLATTPATGLIVQACGDAHLLNFGGFATPERNIFFDINDFDETLPAPWEWDVKRLATSMVIARAISACPIATPRELRPTPPAPTESAWPTMPPCTRSTSGTIGSTSTGSSRSCRR
jgi:hypothetical protein